MNADLVKTLKIKFVIPHYRIFFVYLIFKQKYADISNKDWSEPDINRPQIRFLLCLKSYEFLHWGQSLATLIIKLCKSGVIRVLLRGRLYQYVFASGHTNFAPRNLRDSIGIFACLFDQLPRGRSREEGVAEAGSRRHVQVWPQVGRDVRPVQLDIRHRQLQAGRERETGGGGGFESRNGCWL